MILKSLSALVPVLVLAGCAAEAVPEDAPQAVAATSAQSLSSVDFREIYACSTANADTSIAIQGTQTQTMWDATSPDASYANRAGCARFIADFYLFSSAASTPPGYLPPVYFAVRQAQGPYAFVLTMADCPTLLLSTEVYVKHYGQSSFTYLGTQTAHGQWANGRCGMPYASDLPSSFAPPVSAYDVYRTASSAQVVGLNKMVGIDAQHSTQ